MFEHGIKANPKKIMAISNMGPIRNVKGVQRLTGCVAALSRFISWLGEWGMPLYKLLKTTSASFGEPQSITDIGPNPRRSRTGRTPPLHRGQQPYGKRRAGHRKGGAETPP